MPLTNFVDGTTKVVASWLNQVDVFVNTLFSGATTAADARTALGVSATGTDTTYNVKTANLSDIASAATARTNLGAAASGLATASGLTQSTARILGRTTASTGAIEEISIGSGLTLSAGSLSNSGTTVTAASQSDVDTGTDTTKFLNSSLNKISHKTAQASTSGTSIDFTSIPAGVRRITVMLSGVSTSGTSIVICRIGSGSVDVTGYLGSSLLGGTTTNNTTYFGVEDGANAAAIRHGQLILTLLDAATNTWVMSGAVGRSDTNVITLSAGSKALAGAIDRVRITTVGGADTFDAGSINISYEK